ncbi:MAG: hypothetical protein DMF89_13700 [Acidobacteria bacterium]|nr:MAG: hypothetical protein DMF89_13700 [Acidobacteriota bacterium]
MALALNSAFDRLHLAIDRQQRFTADASHELRTPLSILSAEMEWALARQRDIEQFQASLKNCERAAGRMRGVVEGLLTLARADAGDLTLRRVPVSLGHLVRDVVTLMQPLAEKRHLSPAVVGDAEDVHAYGERRRHHMLERGGTGKTGPRAAARHGPAPTGNGKRYRDGWNDDRSPPDARIVLLTTHAPPHPDTSRRHALIQGCRQSDPPTPRTQALDLHHGHRVLLQNPTK